ncbi:MAG TPA: serine hydrolase domain-containing protein, partial [Pyrinomonadaceae bacterium]|nr:serine hydrolase domain-containing protein [Pyrinomonadaceae bacterium]
FLAKRIFQPAGMTNTSVLNQYKVISNRARGYTIFNDEVVNIRRDIQVELPSHYGIMSTAADLAKWDAALRSEKILKQSTLNLMWTPVRLNNGSMSQYGLGWELDERRGHAIVGHGGITGTEISRFVNDSLTVIVLTNMGSWGEATPQINSWGITIKVAEFYLPDLAYHAIEDRDPQFTAAIRKLFSQPTMATWDETLFTPEVWAELKKLSTSNEKYLKSLGKLREIQLVEQTQKGEARRYVYRLSYDGRSQTLIVVRNKAGKVTSIWRDAEDPDE